MTGMWHRARRPLVIGLVNSMPGEAFAQTDRQFHDILQDVAPDGRMHLRRFVLDPHAPDRAGYEPLSAIGDHAIDGLIVTGSPPRAPVLEDEPYWRQLTWLVDRVTDRGISAVWSCLAAHVAVYHLDGLERRRRTEKLSGLFACRQMAEGHPLLRDLPQQWAVPHSRYNDVSIADLIGRDYLVLSTSPEAGADLFAKNAGALQLFCQGHPEYDADTLLREYRRDIRQFLAGARETYPAMPQYYFNDRATAALEAFRDTALRDRQPALMVRFPPHAAAGELTHAWRQVARGLYANWLAGLTEHASAHQAAKTSAFG